MGQLATPDHSPSQVVSAQELADRFRGQFTADERRVMELRQTGSTWDEIAARLGVSAEALRKSFSRAVDAAAQAHPTTQHFVTELPRGFRLNYPSVSKLAA